MTELRSYQSDAIEAVRRYWRNGGENPLVEMATGTGKSLTMAGLIKGLLHEWPSLRVVVLVHVRELVSQDAMAMLRAWPGAPIGINSAGLGKRDRHSQILFASIQSVYKSDIGPRDLVLIDESHLVPKDGEGMYQTFLTRARELVPDMRVAGFTATPYRSGSGRLDEGEGRIFSKIVYEYGIGKAIRDGYLSTLISKATATLIDVSGVHVRGGEFVARELEVAVDKDFVTKAAVQEIIDYGASRRAWIAFCTGVEHAEHVRDEIRRHDISCEMVSGHTPKGERDRILSAFKAGSIKCITNCSVLCLSDDTEILTSDGFVGIDDMSPDHKIAAWKEDGGIEFSPPSLIVRREVFPGEKMVCSEGDNGVSIRVTSNHRMVVRCGEFRGKTKVVSAFELVGKKRICIPSFGNAEPNSMTVITPTRSQDRAAQIRSTSYNLRKRGFFKEESFLMAVEQVDRLRAMAFKAPHELSLPECAFIGFWLGDGTRSNGRVSITQSLAYPDHIDWIDKLLVDAELHFSRSEYAPASKTTNCSIRWTLARGTGGYNQKVDGGYYRISPYLDKQGSGLLRGLTRAQIDALLDGLWRADGNHHGTSRPTDRSVTATQHSLFNLLQEICSTRGINATIYGPILGRKDHHKPQWKFSWGQRKDWSVANFVMEEPRPNERVWCITSSTSFLICRRKGKVFVTGNTTGFDAPNVDMIALLRPTLSPGLYCQMLGRGTRLADGKTDCLILDFARNIMRHGPVDKISVRSATKKGEEKESVRAKECPDCQALLYLGALECPVCGHSFRHDEDKLPKHGVRADSEHSILSTGAPTWINVQSMKAFPHEKLGSPTSMRVEYFCGLTTQREWVCLGHDGYPRSKAVSWWNKMGGRNPVPITAEEGIARFGELGQVEAIQIRPNGKFFDVVGVKLQRRAA